MGERVSAKQAALDSEDAELRANVLERKCCTGHLNINGWELMCTQCACLENTRKVVQRLKRCMIVCPSGGETIPV